MRALRPSRRDVVVEDDLGSLIEAELGLLPHVKSSGNGDSLPLLKAPDDPRR